MRGSTPGGVEAGALLPMQVVLHHGRAALVLTVGDGLATIAMAGCEPVCVPTSELEPVVAVDQHRCQELVEERAAWVRWQRRQRARLGTSDGERAVAEEHA